MNSITCEYTGEGGELHECNRNHSYCISKKFYKNVLFHFQTKPRNKPFTVSGNLKNFDCKHNPLGPKATFSKDESGFTYCLMCLNKIPVSKKVINLEQYRSIKIMDEEKKCNTKKKKKKKKNSAKKICVVATHTPETTDTCYKFICNNPDCQFLHDKDQQDRKKALKVLMDIKQTVHGTQPIHKPSLMAARKQLECLEALDIPEITTYGKKKYYAPNIISFFFSRVNDAHSNVYLQDFINRCISRIIKYSIHHGKGKKEKKEPPQKEPTVVEDIQNLEKHFPPMASAIAKSIPAHEFKTENDQPGSTTMGVNPIDISYNNPEKIHRPPPGFTTIQVNPFESHLGMGVFDPILPMDHGSTMDLALKRENDTLKLKVEQCEIQIHQLTEKLNNVKYQIREFLLKVAL